VFVLGAFSGFLTAIAPPDETGTSMAVGVASLSMLVVLLIIMALAKNQPNDKWKKYWLAASVVWFVIFIGFAYKYNNDRGKLTFLFPPDEEEQSLYVGGGDEDLTQAAKDAKSRQPALTSAQLVAGFGGLPRRTAVWSADAIESASETLKIDYVVMVVSLGAAIFCLTEGILRSGAA
jgi:hypothetical protein